VEYVNSVLELIGNTPLLKLNRVGRGVEANVFVKLEYLNPSGSYKDRMALAMVEAAEKGLTWNGKRLKPGGVVADASAGNTAPALAFVCAVKGYRCRLCTYRNFLRGGEDVSARLKITGAFGAEVYVCPVPRKEILKDLPSERERSYSYVIAGKTHMYELERDNPDVVWVDQIYNRYNPIGHMQMGREIYRQLDGGIDAWGCSIGSGGAFMGVTLALKEKGVKPYTFGVAPADSDFADISADLDNRDERGKPKILVKMAELMGLEKWLAEESIVETMHRMGYPDEWFGISSEEARAMANRLCSEEGIYCGMSSGANVLAAMRVAERMKADQNVVTVIVDRRDRYLGEYPNERYVV